ncbi:hypothetical protein UXB74_24830, partial [Escherichia marmotae]|nr:hypothetical protein [Escherichia marmotae]
NTTNDLTVQFTAMLNPDERVIIAKRPLKKCESWIEDIYIFQVFKDAWKFHNDNSFRRYPVPQKFVVCCEYCLSQQEQKVLRSTSLRAISYSLINAWNSSPGPDPQNSDEVRYFLPRLLEL